LSSGPSGPHAKRDILEDLRREVSGLVRDETAIDKYRRRSKSHIERLYGTSSREYVDLTAISFYPGWATRDPSYREKYFHEGVAQSINYYDVLLEGLLYEADVTADNAGSRAVADSRSVFLVHGHDHNARDAVARVLEKSGLDVVILDEKASASSTLIEKFERHSSVAFAVVLMTPDDFGRSAGEPKELARTRQNVIFELGYFFCKLGRDRVVAILGEGLEKPSDIDGITFIPMKHANWRTLLMREVLNAGLAANADWL
jgi:predicted nucleotide-binding protein